MNYISRSFGLDMPRKRKMVFVSEILSSGMHLPRTVVLTLPSQHSCLPSISKSDVFPPQLTLRAGGRRSDSIFRYTQARLRVCFLLWLCTRTPWRAGAAAPVVRFASDRVHPRSARRRRAEVG